MSMGVKFQINKVNRLIQQKGIDFVFERSKLNEYKEPIKGEYDKIEVRGYYHEESSYVKRTTSDGSTVKSTPQPMILCSVESGKLLKQDDELAYNGKRYKVSGVQNVNQMDVCCDVSLELIQDGSGV